MKKTCNTIFQGKKDASWIFSYESNQTTKENVWKNQLKLGKLWENPRNYSVLLQILVGKRDDFLIINAFSWHDKIEWLFMVFRLITSADSTSRSTWSFWRCVECSISIHSGHTQDFRKCRASWKIHLCHCVRIWTKTTQIGWGLNVEWMNDFFTTVALKEIEIEKVIQRSNLKVKRSLTLNQAGWLNRLAIPSWIG